MGKEIEQSSEASLTRGIRSQQVYGHPTHLPFYQYYPLKVIKNYPIDPSWAWESCASKIITGGAFGAVGGIALGLFMGAMSSDTSGIQVINGREVPMAPMREQLRAGYKTLGGKTLGWAKSFGILTALYTPLLPIELAFI